MRRLVLNKWEALSPELQESLSLPAPSATTTPQVLIQRASLPCMEKGNWKGTWEFLRERQVFLAPIHWTLSLMGSITLSAFEHVSIPRENHRTRRR